MSISNVGFAGLRALLLIATCVACAAGTGGVAADPADGAGSATGVAVPGTDEGAGDETSSDPCAPEEPGAQRACTVDNEHGSCFGLETCDATEGWKGCDAATPAEESCDGADNDCDDEVDEGFVDTDGDTQPDCLDSDDDNDGVSDDLDCAPTDPEVSDAAACDDGDPCTDDTCDGAVGCVHTAVGCEDDNPCTEDSCLPSGLCEHAAQASGDCDDGDDCTVGDTCEDGACLPGPAIDCADGEACTTDDCIDGECVNDPADGADCEDGDLCTVGDSCSAGGCLPGPAMDCGDDDPCTENEACVAGECTSDPADCDDGDPCTADLCVAGECQFPAAADGTACESDVACGPAACFGGQCGGAPSGTIALSGETVIGIDAGGYSLDSLCVTDDAAIELCGDTDFVVGSAGVVGVAGLGFVPTSGQKTFVGVDYFGSQKLYVKVDTSEVEVQLRIKAPSAEVGIFSTGPNGLAIQIEAASKVGVTAYNAVTILQMTGGYSQGPTAAGEPPPCP